MRFAVLVKATKESESGVLPSSKMLAEMGKFNEQLANDGMMLAGEGLQASSKGARLRFEGGHATVTAGPFSNPEELVAGFWIIRAKSMDDVVERFKRAPFSGGAVLEIRQIFEAEDFGDNLPSEVRELEHRLRSQTTP